MKKFLIILVAAAFVACNNDGTSDATDTDTITADTTTPMNPMDTTTLPQDTTRTDTTGR